MANPEEEEEPDPGLSSAPAEPAKPEPVVPRSGFVSFLCFKGFRV